VKRATKRKTAKSITAAKKKTIRKALASVKRALKL
jgi:hypothetical protein